MALDARAAAARILAKVLLGKSLNQVMPGLLAEVPDRDQGLAQQLSYGTLRQYHRLTAVLDQLLDKPLRAKDGDVSALLLIGLYQLDALRVPDHAAVAATVEATRALENPGPRVWPMLSYGVFFGRGSHSSRALMMPQASHTPNGYTIKSINSGHRLPRQS